VLARSGVPHGKAMQNGIPELPKYAYFHPGLDVTN